VPGVESLPSWLGFMSKLFDDLGGTSGTLGRSKHAMVFGSPNNPYVAAPVICYESIYSDYVTSYSRLGANVITIITNDGWWGNTPGYHQHQNMARLRAIENGCWVARSANTGISCFISPRGDVYQPQPWDLETAIKMDIPPIPATTFYAKHGDWISLLAAALALILLGWAVVKSQIKNSKLQ
jgi:apolipoprotein N-acyltransferase